MVIGLFHAILVLQRFWERNFTNGYRVINLYIKISQPYFCPFAIDQMIHLEKQAAIEKTFPPHDGRAPWYYPLVGMLYVHKETRTAVFSHVPLDQRMLSFFESYNNEDDSYPRVINGEDITEYVVASNGYLYSPAQGATVQNDIRKKMTKQGETIDRTDHAIHASIEYTLMRAYAMRYAPT